MNALKGYLGFKGERGFSAYEIAVQNGFEGTEQDWLATLGTSSHFTEDKTVYKGSVGQKEFDLPNKYTSNSFVEIYVEGQRLNSEQYTVNTSTRKIILTNSLNVDNTNVEVVLLTMSTNALPIVTTIDEEATNETTPGTKAVYDFIKVNTDDKQKSEDIQVITGVVQNIKVGEVVTTDVDYPEGFTKANTLIIGKMVSSNNNYYDTSDLTDTPNGFPVISMIALTDEKIRVWLRNNSTTLTRNGYFKITLLRK